MLTQEQVELLTEWDEATIERMIAAGEISGGQQGFDPVEVYRLSPRAREAFDQLLAFAADRPVAMVRWRELKYAGLMATADRAYSLGNGVEIWWFRLTELGREVVSRLQEQTDIGLGLD